MTSFIKKFQEWFAIKKQIDTSSDRPLFNEGQIWWCQIGENVGDEENGKGSNFMRPVIVIKKFNRNICLVVPTSSKLKDNRYYFPIHYKDGDYSALVSQIKVIDSKRFRKRITQLSNNDLTEIKDYLKQVLF